METAKYYYSHELQVLSDNTSIMVLKQSICSKKQKHCNSYVAQLLQISH